MLGDEEEGRVQAGQSGGSTPFQRSFLREGRRKALLLLSLSLLGFLPGLRSLSIWSPHTLEGSCFFGLSLWEAKQLGLETFYIASFRALYRTF